MPTYLPKPILVAALNESRALNTVTPDMFHCVQLMVTELDKKYKFRFPDEVFSAACLATFKAIQRIDPAKNPFSYLTCIIRNEATKIYRQDERQKEIKRGATQRFRRKVNDDIGDSRRKHG